MACIKVQTYLIKVIVPLAGIQAICLVCSTVYWSYVRANMIKGRDAELCFPKNVYTKFTEQNVETEREKRLRKAFSVTNNKICGGASDVLRYMSYMATEDLYNTASHPEVVSIPQFMVENCAEVKVHNPYLKLSQLDGNRTVYDRQTTALFWKPESPSNLMNQTGLSYIENNGRIQVEKEGLYFITSQIRAKLQVGNKQISEHFEHRIHRFSHKKETTTIILANMRTPCEPATPGEYHTSVVGALFYLDMNDQIYITSSHPDALVTQGTGNHFTIFVL